MSARISCDQCGKSNHTETALDWVEIDATRGLNSYSLSYDPFANGPLHLCRACWGAHYKIIQEHE